MPEAVVDGVRLWYEVVGEGEPMVLLGGPGLGRHNFDPVIPLLQEQHALLNFDQRGYGRSDAAGLDDATAAIWADDTVRLMDAIGWERAHVHGTSFGGAIALTLAARHPERCLSVVHNAFYAKADVPGKLVLESMEALSRAVGVTRPLAAFVALQGFAYDYIDAHPEVVDETLLPMLQRTPEQTWQAAIRAMQQLDLSDDLPNLRMPVLVVAGELDHSLDLAPSGIGLRKIAELVPNGELVVLDGVGHITIVEAPERHAEAVLSFTRSLAATR